MFWHVTSSTLRNSAATNNFPSTSCPRYIRSNVPSASFQVTQHSSWKKVASFLLFMKLSTAEFMWREMRDCSRYDNTREATWRDHPYVATVHIQNGSSHRTQTSCRWDVASLRILYHSVLNKMSRSSFSAFNLIGVGGGWGCSDLGSGDRLSWGCTLLSSVSWISG